MYGAMCVYGQNKKDALWLLILSIQIYFLSSPPSSFIIILWFSFCCVFVVLFRFVLFLFLFLRKRYSRARWKSLGLVYGFSQY